MAVVTLYMSDLDPEKRMFKSKKEADEHDKKLELAEGLASFISQQLTTIDEELAETLGMFIAEHKEPIMQALKGKPQALFEQSDSVGKTEKTANSTKEKGTDTAETSEKVISLK